jgi:hypothetical protein
MIIIVSIVAVIATILLLVYIITPAPERSIRRCARITALLPIALPMLIAILLMECFAPKPTEIE